MERNTDNPPRLLYWGDLPAEPTVAGPAQLHRLLQHWPADRLMCLMPRGTHSSRPPGSHFCWRVDPFPVPRRLRSLREAIRLSTAPLRVGGAEAAVARFAPQAIVTIAEGYAFLSAAELARRLAVPLHLIVHDEWSRRIVLPAALRGRADRAFASVWHAAASRLCISPFLEEAYRARYGLAGGVLYPSRSPEVPEFPDAPQPSAERPLTIAFAGSLLSIYLDSLTHWSKALRRAGGRLAVVGGGEALRSHAARPLRAAGVHVLPFVPIAELVPLLRREADALLVPMAFRGPDADYARIAFPSKLAEYTAAGLPVVIHGPRDCSAVRWAADRPGWAWVVSEADGPAIDTAVAGLADGTLRRDMGRRALEVGRSHFAADVVVGRFREVIGNR